MEELIETNSLYQMIEEPTKIRNEGSSCIDLIITDQANSFVAYGVHPSLDEHCQHQIIYGNLNVSLPSPPPYRRTINDYPKADVHVIKESISSTYWASLLYGLSPTEMVDKFIDVLSELFTLHIPNRVVKCDDRDPPWMKQELNTAIKRKHRVYAKFVKRRRKMEDWNHVKNLQNETTKMIINAKNEYCLHLGRRLSDNLNGPKTYWSIRNRLIIKKNVTNIPPLLENRNFIANVKAKANVFNVFLSAKCREVETGSTIPSFIPQFQMPLLNMNIDRDKVFRIITSLDTNKAHGCNGIPAAMIKICDQSVLEPLCCIFERCLETGVYPIQWKKANVIPVHKKGCKQNKCNYRPISLIPIFGKAFEKLLFDVIYDHLSKHELISSHHSGFLPGETTINQLLLITHNVYRAFDETPSRETRAIFLDLSKAFDTVWHEGLIYKLKASGLSGNIL